MVQQISLTRSQVALVDDEDFERVSAFNWFATGRIRKSGDRSWYAYRTAYVDGRAHNILLHRFIVSAPSGLLVDHRNRDGLDCRRCNLRLCDVQQNAFNRERRLPPSGYRGVHRHYDCWRAQIELNGKIYRRGRLASAEDAARAYDELAREHHGEFAVLNFPEAGL